MNILILAYKNMDCVALNILLIGVYTRDMIGYRVGYVKVLEVKDLCILHVYFYMLTIGNVTARNFVVMLDKFNVTGLCLNGKSSRNRPQNTCSVIVNLYLLIASAYR